MKLLCGVNSPEDIKAFDKKLLPENIFDYKDKLTTYHFETTLQYDKFIYYFIEACVAFMVNYIKKIGENS